MQCNVQYTASRASKSSQVPEMAFPSHRHRAQYIQTSVPDLTPTMYTSLCFGNFTQNTQHREPVVLLRPVLARWQRPMAGATPAAHGAATGLHEQRTLVSRTEAPRSRNTAPGTPGSTAARGRLSGPGAQELVTGSQKLMCQTLKTNANEEKFTLLFRGDLTLDRHRRRDGSDWHKKE